MYVFIVHIIYQNKINSSFTLSDNKRAVGSWENTGLRIKGSEVLVPALSLGCCVTSDRSAHPGRGQRGLSLLI